MILCFRSVCHRKFLCSSVPSSRHLDLAFGEADNIFVAHSANCGWKGARTNRAVENGGIFRPMRAAVVRTHLLCSTQSLFTGIKEMKEITNTIFDLFYSFSS